MPLRSFTSGAYLGWVGHGNVGDEAIWQVCQERFPQVRWRLFSPSWPTRVLGRVVARTAWQLAWAEDVGMLGGGTFINRHERALERYQLLRTLTRRPVPVFGTGVADAHFWSRQPHWKDRMGVWVELLSELPVVGVRGPRSKALLEEAGARNVIVSGDPAVAHHAKCVATETVAAPKKPARIGINYGGSKSPMWGSFGDFHRRVVECGRALRREGHDLAIIAVLPYDVEDCLTLAHDLELPATAVRLVNSPGRFLQEVRSFELLIAVKLHAGVLAAAANVPFVLLEYQPKCLDFAMSIGWQAFTLRGDSLRAFRLLACVEEILRARPQLQARLCDEMCRLSADFDRYCERIAPLLSASLSRQHVPPARPVDPPSVT